MSSSFLYFACNVCARAPRGPVGLGQLLASGLAGWLAAKGVLWLSCARPTGGALTLSAGGTAGSEKPPGSPAPQGQSAPQAGPYTYKRPWGQETWRCQLPPTLPHARHGLGWSWNSWFACPFGWVPWGGGKLVPPGEGGSGEEGSATALLTPVRQSSVIQGKKRGFWNLTALGPIPTLLLTSFGTLSQALSPVRGSFHIYRWQVMSLPHRACLESKGG